jgi:predicted deacetylase
MKTIWIRADDAGRAAGQFRQFHAELRARGIPVTYAAIPGLLTPGDVTWLHETLKEGCAVVQHGYRHADYSGQALPQFKYEFGPGRTRTEQERDIRQGLRLMDTYFSESWTRAFVPPWHGLDSTTLALLAGSGHAALSTSVFEQSRLAGNALPWHPVHAMVDLELNNVKSCAERVMGALMTAESVGVLFHPAELAKDGAPARLQAMLAFLMQAAERAGARFGTIREVMAHAAPAC